MLDCQLIFIIKCTAFQTPSSPSYLDLDLHPHLPFGRLRLPFHQVAVQSDNAGTGKLTWLADLVGLVHPVVPPLRRCCKIFSPLSVFFITFGFFIDYGDRIYVGVTSSASSSAHLSGIPGVLRRPYSCNHLISAASELSTSAKIDQQMENF